MLRRILVLLIATGSALLAQDTTGKGVRLGLNYAAGSRPGIAVLPVRGDRGDSVRAILQRDLDNGDRVTIVGMNVEDLPPVSGEPNFELFAKMGVAGIVAATVTPDGLNIKLYEVSGKTPMSVLGVTLHGAALSASWRMDVHGAADDVERWATGVRGISATRIAFVREGKVWIADSDGEDAVPVPGSSGGGAPAWHPNGQVIAFSMLPDEAGAGGVAVRDLAAGSTRKITPSARSGSWNSPAFSPDGTKLFYSYALQNGANLFSIDWPQLGTPKNITADGTNNLSPSFSPDGRQIVFTSGRLGPPEVYISDADGTGAQRLSTEGFGDQTYRANPAWSPDGRLIAYQSRLNGQFQILTVSPNGKNSGSITSDSQNEDPTWAPDSRHLAFTSRRSGSDQIWVLDTGSGRFRQVTHGAPAKAAAWSPPIINR